MSSFRKLTEHEFKTKHRFAERDQKHPRMTNWKVLDYYKVGAHLLATGKSELDADFGWFSWSLENGAYTPSGGKTSFGSEALAVSGIKKAYL